MLGMCTCIVYFLRISAWYYDYQYKFIKLHSNINLGDLHGIIRAKDFQDDAYNAFTLEYASMLLK